MISIEPASPVDLPAIEDLLRSNGLPTDGLEMAIGSAVVARENGNLAGSAAVELYGRFGLLRSVCVAPDHRSEGLGRRLVEGAETIALERGVAELFLLTETAGEWFPRLGYRPDAVEVAPAEIHASVEFRGACPKSARLFRKRLV